MNRVLSLWIAHRDKGEVIPRIPEATETVQHILKAYKINMQVSDVKMAFAQAMTVLHEANNMLNTTEPWKKTGEEKGKLLVEGIVYVYYATLLLSPFIPEATNKVMKAMGIKPGTTLDAPISIDLNTITKPDILFVKK